MTALSKIDFGSLLVGANRLMSELTRAVPPPDCRENHRLGQKILELIDAVRADGLAPGPEVEALQGLYTMGLAGDHPASRVVISIDGEGAKRIVDGLRSCGFKIVKDEPPRCSCAGSKAGHDDGCALSALRTELPQGKWCERQEAAPDAPEVKAVMYALHDTLGTVGVRQRAVAIVNHLYTHGFNLIARKCDKSMPEPGRAEMSRRSAIYNAAQTLATLANSGASERDINDAMLKLFGAVYGGEKP